MSSNEERPALIFQVKRGFSVWEESERRLSSQKNCAKMEESVGEMSNFFI